VCAATSEACVLDTIGELRTVLAPFGV